MSDNRTASRTPVNWHADLLYGSSQLGSVRITDITSVGMQIIIKTNLPQNHEYEMCIEVPDAGGSAKSTPVRCRVKCVYVILSGQVYRAGLKFTVLSEADRTIIARRTTRLTAHAK